ncbi:MAG TPA: four helix bundle protein [Nitrospiraceae bacterium]|jgi:four helix bundle protein|nr:four helix bundle protein [Nitrospiraceae bacterium]
MATTNTESTQATIRTFEDLDAWKVCRDLRKRVADLCRALPKEEKRRLADQLVRASRSATANLAEGYGRFHYTENMQFARQARGSLYELLDHLTVVVDEGLADETTVLATRKNVIRAISVVNGLIRYLGNAKKGSAV